MARQEARLQKDLVGLHKLHAYASGQLDKVFSCVWMIVSVSIIAKLDVFGGIKMDYH